jgi:tRNA-splicing ligase RtcB (3'-phosphate/5'-hydroxy nucleic acid ligase)
MIEQISDKLYSWASILEWGTREQARKASTMPFIYPHMALMSDAHVGKGATVGSVIPTLGAIMPAAVGVDAGCTDADSEYLSPSGWHKISEYDGGPVMQYESSAGTGTFVQPEAYIVKQCAEFYELKTKYGINQRLSADHRILFWRRTGRDRRRVQEVTTAEEFATEHNRLVQGIKGEFMTTFTPNLGTYMEIPAGQIRVQVMVNADGHMDHRMVIVKVKKQRKVERARKLLTNAGIEFSESQQKDGCISFRFYPPLPDKSYARFWHASYDQLMHVTDECLHWDGNAEERCFYTRDRESADFMHYAFTAVGYRAVLRADIHKDGATDYRVFRHENTMVGMSGTTKIAKVASEDGKAYCFTVPSGFWVMRRGGNIVMTGNCGMRAVRTQFAKSDVYLSSKPLILLRQSIEKAIPLSAGNYNSEWWHGGTRKRVAELEELPGADHAEAISPNWRLQLGSLGSGNHFIECSYDELDRVWLFLHSGSRGVGNRLMNKHIKIAQEKCKDIRLPDRDLAYLTEGTPEFDEYITDLRWSQHFALLNREEMMDRVVSCFEEWAHYRVYPIETVQCHHNYTVQSEVEGKMVWLSRKGAIDASKGVMGLIPGSMGDRSYVVEGKGCELALNSSPHGAGRMFSRSAAKREIGMEELESAMTGIEWRHSEAFLDEAPRAYKPIETVMKDAADLVEIRHTLRQFLNVKGN